MNILRDAAKGASDVLFIYAPGAGSNISDPFGAYLASFLPREGVETWRFAFPYMTAKRGGPDRPGVLEDTWREVIEQAERETGKRVVAGGRSMGGRIASQVVAAGTSVAGLALFAYPLHPPGQPARARTQHLAAIDIPVLFCSGTRDAYGSVEELTEAAGRVAGAGLYFLDGADHGFAVLKASGRTREDVWSEAASALRDFLARLRDGVAG